MERRYHVSLHSASWSATAARERERALTSFGAGLGSLLFSPAESDSIAPLTHRPLKRTVVLFGAHLALSRFKLRNGSEGFVEAAGADGPAC